MRKKMFALSCLIGLFAWGLMYGPVYARGGRYMSSPCANGQCKTCSGGQCKTCANGQCSKSGSWVWSSSGWVYKETAVNPDEVAEETPACENTTVDELPACSDVQEDVTVEEKPACDNTSLERADMAPQIIDLETYSTIERKLARRKVRGVYASSFEHAVVREINTQRSRAGLQPMTIIEEECPKARNHCRFMARFGGLQHASGYAECIAMMGCNSPQEDDPQPDLVPAIPEPLPSNDIEQTAEEMITDAGNEETIEAETVPADENGITEDAVVWDDATQKKIDADAKRVVALWMNSPAHRSFLMGGYNKVAIGRFGQWHTARFWYKAK